MHPFGEHFNALVDFVPDHYDGQTMDEAIAGVPAALMAEGPLLWGTTEQVVAKLRAFGDAGLRHVVLAPVSGLVSKQAADFGPLGGSPGHFVRLNRATSATTGEVQPLLAD